MILSCELLKDTNKWSLVHDAVIKKICISGSLRVYWEIFKVDIKSKNEKDLRNWN